MKISISELFFKLRVKLLQLNPAMDYNFLLWILIFIYLFKIQDVFNNIRGLEGENFTTMYRQSVYLFNQITLVYVNIIKKLCYVTEKNCKSNSLNGVTKPSLTWCTFAYNTLSYTCWWYTKCLFILTILIGEVLNRTFGKSQF